MCVLKLYSSYVVLPHMLNWNSLLVRDCKITQIRLSGTINRSSGSIMKLMKLAFYSIELLALQKPKVVKAKKSVATFKIRKGYVVGWKLTSTQYTVLYKLAMLILARTKEFDGFVLKKANSFGLKNYLLLPETDMQASRFFQEVGLFVQCDFTKKIDLQSQRYYLQHINIPIYKKN